MTRSYFGLFLLSLLAIANANKDTKEASLDSEVVVADGTPETPVIEFDKLPKDVQKIVMDKIIEQDNKNFPSTSVSFGSMSPEEALSSEAVQKDLALFLQLQQENVVPYDLLTPEAKEEVNKLIINQELEKQLKQSVVNYDKLSPEEKSAAKSLFRAVTSGNENHNNQHGVVETLAAIGGSLLGGFVAGVVGPPGASHHQYGYPGAWHNSGAYHPDAGYYSGGVGGHTPGLVSGGHHPNPPSFGPVGHYPNRPASGHGEHRPNLPVGGPVGHYPSRPVDGSGGNHHVSASGLYSPNRPVGIYYPGVGYPGVSSVVGGNYPHGYPQRPALRYNPYGYSHGYSHGYNHGYNPYWMFFGRRPQGYPGYYPGYYDYPRHDSYNFRSYTPYPYSAPEHFYRGYY